MKIHKKAYYTSERIYNEKSEVYYNQEMIDYWKQIFGKDFEELQCKTEKFNEYLKCDSFNTIHLDKMWNVLEELFFEELKYYRIYEDRGTFEAFYAFFIAITKKYFRKICRDKLSRYLFEIFDSQLIKQRIMKISIRTLIYEIHSYLEEDLLKGKTLSEKYKNYITDYLCNGKYIIATYYKYPVMYREIFRCIIYYSNYLKEFAENYKRDFELLKSTFGIYGNLEMVSGIIPLSSDFHRKNRFTFYIEFPTGEKIVYKPRCLNNEILFQKLEKDFLELCGINYVPVKIISRENYGWMEFVENKECTSIAEVQEYYQRYGILMLIIYLLGAKDIHYENIIACGNYPMLIDLEILMSLPQEEKNIKTADENIREKLSKSVVESGMLPLFAWDINGKGVNVSALNGKGGQILPIHMPKVKNIGRADIYITYEYAKTPVSKNFVKYKGEAINPINYINEIQQGFLIDYQKIKENRNDIIDLVRKEIVGITNRTLLRNTQQYEMVLSLSYHPDFMRDALKRELLIYYLMSKKNNKPMQVIERETQAIIRGDIPYFYTKGTETKLEDESGECVKDFFKTSQLELVVKNIGEIKDSDIIFQNSIIYQSIMACQIENKNMLIEKVDEEEYVHIINQKIVEQAIYTKDFTDVSWLTMMNMEYGDRKIVMDAMDDYLYSGKMGILIFLKAYLQSYYNCETQKIADILEKHFFSYTEENAYTSKLRIRPTGIYIGESSIIYGYQVIYRITGNVMYLEYAKKHILYLLQLLQYDKEYDLVGGNAGAILVLVNMYEISGEQYYLENAKQAFNYLKEKIENFDFDKSAICNAKLKRPLAGVAHGCTGYAYAFSKLAYYVGDVGFYELVSRFLNYENSLYSTTMHDWKDMRIEEPVKKTSSAWCHGRMGIYYMWSEAAKYCNDELKSKIQVYINKSFLFQEENEVKESDCLCHGNMGIYEMESARRKKQGNDSEIAYNIYKIREVEELGFMTGKSGIGYWMEKRKKDYPNILLLKV